ncbi:hypothetical protein AAU61_01410 [Desulfocarbo indianensis]|nr:hypothetical protein AAU61_01410 [Desulfocarbo indianensis]
MGSGWFDSSGMLIFIVFILLVFLLTTCKGLATLAYEKEDAMKKKSFTIKPLGCLIETMWAMGVSIVAGSLPTLLT